MAKLKKPKLDINKKEKAFVYEIIGIVAILITIISLAKFGLIGKYLVLSFSLLFGDWYFIFIILVGIFGLYCLIFHKKFELKSIRYYGIILILLSILILTHFSMHEYISNYEGNSLMLTLKLYLSYFRSGNIQMIDGGGVIGCICFYLFYYLLGNIGTIIISILLFFVGIVFLTKKTMKEFVEIFINIVKKIIKFFDTRYKRIVNSVKEISKDYDSKNNFFSKIKKINRNKIIKKEKDSIDNNQIERSECIVTILSNALKHLEIDFENISYLICEHIVVFFVKTKCDINYKVLELSLREKIDEGFLIKYDKFNEQVLIEVNKINPKSLSLYKASQSISKDEFSIVLGMDDRNLLVEVEDNLLIIGEEYNEIEKYVLSIVVFCISQKKYIQNTITILDMDKDFKSYNIEGINIRNEIEFLDEIISEIDNNLELLNLHHKKNIVEYNLFYKDKMMKKYVIINKLQKYVYEREVFEKILYIVQTGKMAGINVIATLTQDVILSNILLSSMEQKVLINNNFNLTNKLIDISYFEILSNDVECFYKDKDLIIRMSKLEATKDEIEKIKTR